MEFFTSATQKIMKTLSSEAGEQIQYLNSIGSDSVDELALELEEIALLAPSKLESGEITQAQYSLIQLLNNKLDELSDNGKIDYWTESALFESSEWEEIRTLAKECLREFN
jgi:hypothetical protein